MNDSPILAAFCDWYLEEFGISFSKDRSYSLDLELIASFGHAYRQAVDHLVGEANQKRAQNHHPALQNFYAYAAQAYSPHSRVCEPADDNFIFHAYTAGWNAGMDSILQIKGVKNNAKE